MKAFLYVVTSIFILVFITLTIVLASNRRQLEESNKLQALGLKLCGTELCILNIVPESTSWFRLKEFFPSIDVNEINEYTASSENEEYNIHFWKNSSNKISVSLSTKQNSTPLQLYNVLLELGSPCTLTITEDGAYLQYPKMVIQVPVNENMGLSYNHIFEPQSPVVSISFERNTYSCELPLTYPTAQNVHARWCGFASSKQYLDKCIIN